MKPPKKNILRKNGVVLESLPNATFRVKTEEGNEIIAHLAGKLKVFKIRILPGDKVILEMTPYDNEKGRIVYRGK